MKRLLANGSPDIYQIAKVFREGEIGRRHQPEFTMAEWYRLGFTLEQMIDDSCQFIHTLINAVAPAKQAFEQPKVHRYREIFCAAIQLDPMTASMQSLQNCATTVPGWHEALGQQLSHDRNAWLDFIASHAVLPQLPANGLQVIRDYPAAQAMLARLNPDRPDVADRFEIFMGGMELANGFRELTDADEQRQRFAADNARRQTSGLPTMSIDTHLLNALEGGLPDCSGVAVGLDRVLMLAGDHDDISATLSFHPGN
jgi:lysyl-tRNA synthetase class 2